MKRKKPLKTVQPLCGNTLKTLSMKVWRKEFLPSQNTLTLTDNYWVHNNPTTDAAERFVQRFTSLRLRYLPGTRSKFRKAIGVIMGDVREPFLMYGPENMPKGTVIIQKNGELLHFSIKHPFRKNQCQL
jgi:hypothetical protein